MTGAESNQKRPLVLILADGMPAGGTERQIVELLKGLKSRGTFRTAFGVLVKGGEREIEAKLYADNILPIKQSSKYNFTLAFSLITLVRKFAVDLIHTFGSVSDLSGILAAKITGVPVINGSIRNARQRLNKRDKISKYTMLFATWIVANSKAGIKAYGVDNLHNTSVIYNGVDFSRFERIRPATLPGPGICMVGNFTHKKDQAALIQALPLILEEYPVLTLVLVGRGRKLDFCRRLSRTLGIEKSVQFVTDCNHPEQYISGSEVGVLLSPQGEGISNVIIEYMVLGKPVIATDLGGNCEIVDNGKTGILLQDHSPETVAKAVIALLNNLEKAEEMGKLGRKVIEDRYNMTQMIEAYEKLYQQLLPKDH